MRCWWMAALPCAMSMTCWWPSRWPGPGWRIATTRLALFVPARISLDPGRLTTTIDLGSIWGAPRMSPGGRRSGGGAESRAGQAMTPGQRAVLEAVDDTPTFLETILIRTDLSIASAAAACDQLAEMGELICGSGWWSRNRT